jgi:hypothetical protein
MNNTGQEYPKCADALRKAGKPYGRQCEECGFGPCKVVRKGSPPDFNHGYKKK